MNNLPPLTDLESDLATGLRDDPLAALATLTALKNTLSEWEREAVFRALETHTWKEIGHALGVTKQAAFQRFGPAWAVMMKERLPVKEWKRTVKERLSGPDNR